MGYLIGQMVFCLLLAFLLGLLLGWLLGRMCCRNRLGSIEEEYKLNLSQAEAERDSYRDKCDDLNGSLSEWQNNSGTSVSGSTPAQFASLAGAEAGIGIGMGWPYPVEEVEGIGPTYGQRLREINIVTTEDLLEKCCEASQQTDTSKHVKVEPFVVGKWVSMCDLMRVPGVRGQFAELLEASGIASTGELARQQGANLASTLARVNAEEHRTPTVPEVDEVSKWIDSAQKLTSIIKSLAPK